MKNKLKNKEQEIIDLYLKNQLTTMKLAEIYNVVPSSICRLLKRYDIPLRKMSDIKRKYTLNEQYFDNIDSEDKAYFLGFLYADGYLNLKNSFINLTLHKKDIEILHLFSKYLNTNKPLRKDRTYFRLSIENKHMSQTLNNLGCVQAKTFKLTFPTFLNDNLIKHFIRGYFDGDGCITKTTNSNLFMITSTHQFLTEIQKILINNCELNKTKFSKRHKQKNDNIFTLNYGGKIQLNRIYHFLYDNANIYLNRKKEKFEQIIFKNHH